jgi:cytochrome c biogenesis protein CcdA
MIIPSSAADNISPGTSPDAGSVATSVGHISGITASSSDEERMPKERETRKSEQQTETSDLDVKMAVCSGANVSPRTFPNAGAVTISADVTNGTTASNIENENRSHRRRAFLSGMAFILAVFLAYYALGFGIFTAVAMTQASSVILLVLGIFVIILGAWNIKDFLCYDKGYNVEIPRSWRPLLKRVLGAVTSPVGAFAAGFIVCLFELPCTGGPYLFILALLADQNTRTEAAFSLLYYNFIFVLPLIIINCLVFWSLPMLQKVGLWKERRIRFLHLFAGLVLITLGVLAVVNSQYPLF